MSRLTAGICSVGLVAGIVFAPGMAVRAVGNPNATPDFNGDGYADLVIPDPYYPTSGQVGAGQIFVVPGSSTGPKTALATVWHQDIAGIPDSAEPSEFFGNASTAGDFNGDGYDDLAASVERETVSGQSAAGAVVVIYGSATGLRGAGADIFSRASAGIPRDPVAGARFGETGLAAGDFDRDGYDELAIASERTPYLGLAFAGSVTVLAGSAAGLSGTGALEIDQADTGVPGDPEDGGLFGYAALAVGDFNGDGRDDLLVGAALATVAGDGYSGAIYAFFGSSGGLRTSGTQIVTRDLAGLVGDASTADQFGAAIPAVADFNHDGFDDVVVADTNMPVNGAVQAGLIILLRGSSAGLTGSGGKTISQDTAGVAGQAEDTDFFGFASLAAGDFDGDGNPDLAVANSLEDLGARTDAGSFYTFPGTGTTIATTGSRVYSQDTLGVPGTAAEYDNFSERPLRAGGDFDGDGYDDLVVTTGREDLGAIPEAGVVMVFRGSPTGIAVTGVKSYRRSSFAGYADLMNTTFGYSTN